MALFGGVYLPCLIGLLPDKTSDTYGRFFAMVWSYLDMNNLPNDFAGQYFMTDFEKNIRDNFNLFWSTAILLGCYFHFSQVCSICIWNNWIIYGRNASKLNTGVYNVVLQIIYFFECFIILLTKVRFQPRWSLKFLTTFLSFAQGRHHFIHYCGY